MQVWSEELDHTPLRAFQVYARVGFLLGGLASYAISVVVCHAFVCPLLSFTVPPCRVDNVCVWCALMCSFIPVSWVMAMNGVG